MLTWAGEPLNTEADGLMNRRGKLDTIAVNGPEDVAVEWDFVDWRAHEQNVIRLRRRIFKATREQDWATVRSLQKLMLGSWSNTLVSVQQVTQRNAGRRTAGIDGEVALSSPPTGGVHRVPLRGAWRCVRQTPVVLPTTRFVNSQRNWRSLVSAKRTPLSLDRPSANLSADADAWVGGAVAAVGERGGPPVTATKPSSAVQVEVRELIKRLTIDIPESQRRALKVQTAERGMKMVDEVRALLEAHYRG